MTDRGLTLRTMGRAASLLRAARRTATPNLLLSLPLVLGIASLASSRGAPGAVSPGGANPGQSRGDAGSAAASCPLDAARQVEAVRVFREIVPVLTHPRCLNCHGGMDILSDRHPGASALEESLNPREAIFTPEFRSALEAQCTTCHDGLSGWTVPPPPLYFVDPASGAPKSAEALCEQMKVLEANGERLVSHFHDDHGGIQFIAAGFAGDRALGDEELARLGLTRERPPGTQAQLTAKAGRWVDLMGARAEWVGDDPSCGCVMPRIRLRIHHRSEDARDDFSTHAGWVDFEGEVEFDVTLTLQGVDSRGVASFWGEARPVRPVQVHYRAAVCESPVSIDEHWHFGAHVTPGQNSMALWFGYTTPEGDKTVTCRARGHTSPDELDILLFDELERMEMPAVSGTTRRETATDPRRAATEWIEVTVLDVSPGA
jgi:hypothetical protein